MEEPEEGYIFEHAPHAPFHFTVDFRVLPLRLLSLKLVQYVFHHDRLNKDGQLLQHRIGQISLAAVGLLDTLFLTLRTQASS